MSSPKMIVAALAAAFFFALGWYMHPDPPVAQAQTQTQHDVQVKTVDHVITKTVVVKEKAPNGTAKETTTVEVTETKDRAKDSQASTAQTVAGLRADPPNTWSLGVDWQPRLVPDAYNPVSMEIGYRAFGPVWVTGSWNWFDHSALIGARLEF